MAVCVPDVCALRFPNHARAIRWLGAALVTLSFGLPALSQLPFALGGIPDPASTVARVLAARLTQARISGPVAGSALVFGNRTGLFLAFHLDQPWYGDEPNASVDGFTRSGARLVAVNRHQPIAGELETDPAFRDLDGQLFTSKEEAEAYPVKLYEVLGR